MAHILAYGEQCPAAKPIIHLGATSCYVGDNTDIILQRTALMRIKRLLISLLTKLYDFADRHKALPCLAYTHFQAAQPTTMGKRAALWIADLLLDLEQLDFTLGNLKLLGCRGTTGTSASFLELFGGNPEKVKALESKIAAKMNFATGSNSPQSRVYPVSGQTYSRKVDYYTLSVLSGIAQSANKFSNDIRLLSHLKVLDEPFEKSQVGSSAMAYKRNPVRSERMAALARHVTVNALNPALTAGGQWLERTLDDSANRRIAIPEAFLAVDGILSLYLNIAAGMTIYPKVIQKHLNEELPFMATENILMYCVKKGGDRQVLHEQIRLHSIESAKNIKQNGSENDLFIRILKDETFALNESELSGIVNAQNFTGMAKEQTEEFLREVKAIIDENGDLSGVSAEIRV
jgi:adenylosuccinate lyase